MKGFTSSLLLLGLVCIPGCYCNSDLMYELVGGYYLIAESRQDVVVHRNGYDSSYLIPCTVLDHYTSRGVAVIKQKPNRGCDDFMEGDVQYWIIHDTGERPAGPFTADSLRAYVTRNELSERLLRIL